MANPSKGKYDDAVFSFVNEYWKKNFRSPTLHEIKRACGISSTSVTRHVVHKLFYVNEKARGIVPLWVQQAISKARYENQA